MFRSIMRTIVITVVCIAAVLLVGTALVAARGSDLAGWTPSGPGPVLSQSRSDSPSAPSATNAPANPSATQDADNDNDASSGEGSEVGEQSTDDTQEQEVVGTVASVDATNSMFTINTTSGAVTFVVTSQTQFEDGLNALSSLQQGTNVKVHSIPQASGHAIAVDVKGTSDSNAPDNSDSNGSGNNQ